MQRHWDIVEAMLHCHYKAWTLAKSENRIAGIQSFIDSIPPLSSETPLRLSGQKVTPADRIVLSTLYHLQNANSSAMPTVRIVCNPENSKPINTGIRISGPIRQVQKKLTADLHTTLSLDHPPTFYRNAHCRDCQFHDTCYARLKEKDCISLLPGM